MRKHTTPSATVLRKRPLPMAIVCALLACLPAAAQDDQNNTTIAQRLDQLQRTRSSSRVDLAERVALEFCIAASVGDGKTAIRRLPQIGYQPLPLRGPLPLDPPRPIPSDKLRQRIDKLPDVPLQNLPARRVRVVGRDAITRHFGECGRWMLPNDYGVMIAGDRQRKHWIDQPTFLVIRISGPAKNPQATIVAGNVIEAIEIAFANEDDEHG